MYFHTVRRISLQLIAIIAVASLAACARDSNPLEPTTDSHTVAAPRRASADDTPPIDACRSGWYEINGKWVCDQP